MTEYFYVSEQIREFAIRKGISWLAREAKSSGAGWIAVMESGSIRIFSRYRGLSILRLLSKPSFQADIFGLNLKLITPQNLPANYENLHVLAIFPSDQFIEKLLNVAGATKTLVIPWSTNDVEYWIGLTGATLYSRPLDKRISVNSNS